LGDLIPFGVGEVVGVVLYAPDQHAELLDLGLAWGGLGLGPVFEVGRGNDSFAVGEEPVQVCLQLGEVGYVGAEVPAAEAAEPERARGAGGLDVGRFGADP
jgi:hypothetical protein